MVVWGGLTNSWEEKWKAKEKGRDIPNVKKTRTKEGQKTKELVPLNWGAGEDSWKSLEQQGDQTSQSKWKSILNIHQKDWGRSWSSSTLGTWCAQRLTGKVPYAGKDWGQKEKRASEGEMAGGHHRCNEQELGQTLGDGEGKGGLAYCSLWGRKELELDWATAQQQYPTEFRVPKNTEKR